MATRNKTVAVLFACALSTAVARAQTTYFVNGSCGDDAWTASSPICEAPNGPKRTIQAGIDASVTGDTVIVADGVYTGFGNRDLDFGGRDIHLRSESLDPELCVIDCEGTQENPHRGFYFHNDETNAAVVEGFTLRGGHASQANGRIPFGGAVYCLNGSSPTIRGCHIVNNIADENGNNGFGGGIFANSARPLVEDCLIAGNTAAGGAGGIINSGVVRNCVIVDNTVTNAAHSWPGGGGGLYLLWGGLAVDCTVARNRIMNANFVCCSNGGGVLLRGDSQIVNCLVTANSVSGTNPGAGGIQIIESAVVTNCTIVGNTSGSLGAGAIYTSYGSRGAQIANSVLWGNSRPAIRDQNREALFRYCDIQGGWSGNGNIALAPRFQNRSAGDFRLKPISPCIDAADNTAVPADILTDLDGNPRFVDDPDTPDTGVPGGPGGSAIVDMGAYEFQGECDPCDMNCDAVVDEFDIEPFLALLFDPNARPCDDCAGDTNADGTVDAFDIEPFLECLFP